MSRPGRLQGALAALVLTASLSVMLGGSALADRPPRLALSDAEREWLARHPQIRIGVMDAWPPLNYVDAQGSPAGIGADYASAINKRLDGAIVLVPAPFKKNYDRVLEGQLDAVMDITRRPDREPLFEFTRAYIEIPHAIVGRRDGDYYKSEEDLAGRVVALEKGFYNVTHFRKNFPGVSVREYGSTADALDAVSRGEADAYAGNRAVAIHLLEKELLNNLRLMGRLSESRSTLQFGVRKDNAPLASILDKALASMTPDEERAIRQKWLPESQGGPELTPAERAWLKSHPTIRVALDPAWAPVEFLDRHGIPQGISADYLRKVGEMLGTRFDIAKGPSWPELVESVRLRKIDMFASVVRTPEREDDLAFSDVYLSLPIGIFTRQDSPYVGSMDELAGKRVAVLRGYGAGQLLKANHPGLHLVELPGIDEGLRALSRGDADALVESTVTAGYALRRLGIGNVKLAGETPYRYRQSMGVRKDWPELVPILDKALRSIPESERDAIYSKWVSLGQEPQVDYALIWKVVLAAALAIGLVVFWNRRLGREVALRTASELALREAKERAEAADRLKSAFLATMSHELRTPLNSIIGFTGILRQGLSGPLNAEQDKQLGMVNASAQHLLSLISDILDISKIEAGELKVAREPFDLREAVLKVVQSVRPIAAKKGLDLSVEIADDAARAMGDARRVEQVLINLLGNAVKFTEKGGVRVSCALEGESCVTRVADTGIGIGEADLPGLFKPFHQVDTGLSRKYEGTGLGLSICRKLVELMGGRIEVESREGAGSTFSFSLPAGRRNA